MTVDVTKDPAAETVSVEEAVKRLREAKDIALRAANNAKLKLSERNQASVTANTISDEVIRILVDDFANRTADYRDVAKVMPELIKPLRDAKKRVREIVDTLQEVNNILGILDRALAIALKFAA